MASNIKPAPAAFTSDIVARLLRIGHPVEFHADNARGRTLSPHAYHVLPNPMQPQGRTVAERYANREERSAAASAKAGSAALLEALRAHRPEICGR